VKLKPGDEVWFVASSEWPRYAVRSARYACPAEGATQAAQLATADGRTIVALARIFVSRQAAQQEAAILERFAAGRSELRGAGRTRAQMVYERVRGDRRHAVMERW
jgi:hypothetical protein